MYKLINYFIKSSDYASSFSIDMTLLRLSSNKLFLKECFTRFIFKSVRLHAADNTRIFIEIEHLLHVSKNALSCFLRKL